MNAAAKPKRLFVVDAMAMAFRNYHAFGARPITTANGLPTSAVFGSAQFLLSLIEKEQPDYLVIATDSREPTFRHEMYPAYKANRTAMPEDLAVQLPYLFRLFDALGIKTLKTSGMEADDLIGALVTRVRSPDLKCFIVSGDKDFMQLIDDNTFLYCPKKGGEVQIVDRAGVLEKFAVAPEHVIDVLAIIGDASDNVPGVHGIGEKGAAKLIHQFGSLEGLYQHIDAVKNEKQRQALLAARETAFLSRRLVTIACDLDGIPPLESIAYDPSRTLVNRDLLKLFRELEFRRLSEKVEEAIQQGSVSELDGKTEAAFKADVATAEKISVQTQKNYSLIKDPQSFARLLERLAVSKHFAFDTETTGLDVVSDQVIGLSFAFAEGEACYLPVHEKHLTGTELDRSTILASMKKVFADPATVKIAHNLKFDMQMLANCGVTIAGALRDTMLQSYLIESTARSHGIDACALEYLSFTKIPTSSLIGKRGEISMIDVDLELLTNYASEDADVALRLYKFFAPLIAKKNLNYVFEQVEMPLVPILARMEQKGIYINPTVLNEISQTLDDKIAGLEKDLYSLAEEEFNLNSTKQLQRVIFEKLKIHEQLALKRIKKTKSGYSTDVSVLEAMAAHPFASALLDYRTMTKLKNTYVDTLPDLIHPKSGRLHTHFHQTGTATGRLSSSDPNLQNIPIRSEMGREIRRAFAAEDSEHVLISADYSQVELRLLAHLSGDEALIDAFQQGQDIHRATAARIFGVGATGVTPEMRAQAKAINFGIIYGMGPTRLARETGVSFKEAKEFIERYFNTYPKIRGYLDESIALAKERSFTMTMTGRRRPLPEIASADPMVYANAQNIAVNSPIQGSAADLIKLAMIRFEELVRDRKLSVHMLLQVHDELVFECPRRHVEEAIPLIKEAMEGVMNLSVPLVADAGYGDNWLVAH